ncbi:hypothetical protein C2142_20235 [Streptomyces sp. CB01881]|nr:hypothetical protein C2142_20235 [Streptomyces sp. CB01881]
MQLQPPSAAAVAPQATIRSAEAAPPDRAVTVTLAPGSARPANFGLAARTVSPAAGAVSTGRSGGTVSTTRAADRPGLRFPAASTAVGVSWYRPSARFSTGRQAQPPSDRTAVLHSSAAASSRTPAGWSATETVLPGSPVPVSWRPGSLVYSGRLSTGAVGGAVFTVIRTGSPRSTTPPLVVSTGVRLCAPAPSGLPGRQDQSPPRSTRALQSTASPSRTSTVAPVTAPSPRTCGRASETTLPSTGIAISGRAAPTVSRIRWSETSPESAKPPAGTSWVASRPIRNRAQVSPDAAPAGTVHPRVAVSAPAGISACTRSAGSKRPLRSKSTQPARMAGAPPTATGTTSR